jgi:hypothetical protein
LEKKETYLTELETQAPNPPTSPKRSKLQNLKVVESASQLPPSSQVDLAPINEHKTIIDDIKFSSNESISNLGKALRPTKNKAITYYLLFWDDFITILPHRHHPPTIITKTINNKKIFIN